MNLILSCDHHTIDGAVSGQMSTFSSRDCILLIYQRQLPRKPPEPLKAKLLLMPFSNGLFASTVLPYNFLSSVWYGPGSRGYKSRLKENFTRDNARL